MGVFIRKQRLEETVQAEYCYARFDEEWTVVEKVKSMW